MIFICYISAIKIKSFIYIFKAVSHEVFPAFPFYENECSRLGFSSHSKFVSRHSPGLNLLPRITMSIYHLDIEILIWLNNTVLVLVEKLQFVPVEMCILTKFPLQNLGEITVFSRNVRCHNNLCILSGMKWISDDTHTWCPWKLSNFQDPHPPCPSTFKMFPPPWPWTSNFKRIHLPTPPPSPADWGTTTASRMWTNEIKIKTKPSQVTFKLTMRFIVRFSPQTAQWYH